MSHRTREECAPHPRWCLPVKSCEDWNTWKWMPPHSLRTGLWKPLHDHIAWGHLRGALQCCGLTTTFSAFCSATWSTSLKFFSHLKAMVWCRWKEFWEIRIARAGPVTDSWGQLSSSTSEKHLFEFAVFSRTSPDVLYLGEIDRPSCETVGNI